MKWKEVNDLSELKPGMVVRGWRTKEPHIVTANYGNHVTAVSTIDITNPPEWEILSKPQSNESNE